jgi:hypothetical protein
VSICRPCAIKRWCAFLASQAGRDSGPLQSPARRRLRPFHQIYAGHLVMAMTSPRTSSLTHSLPCLSVVLTHSLTHSPDVQIWSDALEAGHFYPVKLRTRSLPFETWPVECRRLDAWWAHCPVFHPPTSGKPIEKNNTIIFLIVHSQQKTTSITIIVVLSKCAFSSIIKPIKQLLPLEE